jgi:hypothetical protein
VSPTRYGSRAMTRAPHTPSVTEPLGVSAGSFYQRCVAAVENDRCFECGIDLGDGPVYLSYFYCQPHGRLLVPFCERCGQHRHLGAVPARYACTSCGRPVVRTTDSVWRVLDVCCSRRCYAAARTRQARERRRRARADRVCDTCGETFTPSRSDAVYCSNACRQRAYRGRKGSGRGVRREALKE